MTKTLRIIYIVSDGRSGSTLLESILNNSEQVISVGECFRFWERFYRNETICGCSLKIAECELWAKVDNCLAAEFKDYSPREVEGIIKKVLRYKNFHRLHEFTNTLLPLVRSFYNGIAAVSGKSIILDSSKSPSWAKLLSMIPELDVSFIHLERTLPYVASSWKKKLLLPEFTGKEVYMPVKSNLAILRTWIRVRLLARKLRHYDYLFVRYEDLCKHPDQLLHRIKQFLEIDLPSDGIYYYRPSHAIAGNPMRLAGKAEIVIKPNSKTRQDNLNRLEFYFFYFVQGLANVII